MIVGLGEVARVGARDPREVVGPMVEALLAERAAARGDRRYGDADRVRDALTGAGVEVRDTPTGTEWGLTTAR
jgi:cysteinyl-tRNA synthetase